MSCDVNTHRVTVLGNQETIGRHRYDDGRCDDVYLKDVLSARWEDENTREILREVLENRSVVVAAVAEARRESVESKAELLKTVLENRVDAERLAREQLRDLISICGNRKCGGH